MKITWFVALVRRIPMIHAEAAIRAIGPASSWASKPEHHKRYIRSLRSEIAKGESYRVSKHAGMSPDDQDSAWDRFRSAMGRR